MFWYIMGKLVEDYQVVGPTDTYLDTHDVVHEGQDGDPFIVYYGI